VIFSSSFAQGYRLTALRTYSGFSQESRAVARKFCNAAAGLFGLKFAKDIHYKSEYPNFDSQASELQTYQPEAEFNTKWRFKVIRSHVLESVERRKGTKALSNTI